jgi:hypothetical protein
MEISLYLSTSSLLKTGAQLLGIFLILANLTAGCSPGSETRSAAVPASISPTQTIVTGSPKPVELDQNEASSTPTEKAVQNIKTCVSQGDSSPLPNGHFELYPQAILQFLNEGGWVDELDEALYAAGVANMPVPVDAAEMTGDEFEEVVVSIFDPGSANMPPSGMLLIYTCHQNEYQLAYQEDSRPIGPSTGTPGITFLQDLNADGTSELVASSRTCGAHTCFERVQVLGWDGREFINRLDGLTDDLPHPTVYLQPSGQDGIYDIYITASGVGSVGAGPQRNMTRYWAYNADTQRWQISSLTLEPSMYRIHVLHDALAATRDGNYQEALLRYNRAISDTTLEDWADPALEQAWISAFARYQLVAIYTLQDRPTFADVILGEMEDAYPPDSLQHGYYEMAVAYLSGYLKGGGEAGCAAAVEYATANPGILEPLGMQNFGYGNPELIPRDVCP